MACGHDFKTILRLIVAGVGFTAVAFCQTATAVEDLPTDLNSDGLQEIVVQAQRIEQNLQGVPVAVQAVTAADLDSRKLHDLTQMTTAVPSLEITTDNAFTLRGVGSQIFTPNVDASVGTMVDDVSLGVPLFMSGGAFNDVAQVEVLTGPQGLLFGRNTSAGLINIETRKPEIGAFAGNAYVEYDDRDQAPGGHFGLITNATLNLPVTANSALRLNIANSDQDPVTIARTDISPDSQLHQERLDAKAKYLWEPTDQLSVYLIGDFDRERGIGGIFETTYRSAAPGGVDAPAVEHDGCIPSATNLCYGVDAPFFRDLNTGGVSLKADWKVSEEVTVSDILAWRNYTLNQRLDGDATSAPILDIIYGLMRYNQYSNELRLAYNGGPVDGQAGLYAFWSNNKGQSEFSGTSGTGIPQFLYGTNDYRLTSRSSALYGQLNYHVTDAFQLLVGTRVTHDDIGVAATANNYDETSVAFPFGPFGPPSINVPFVNVFGPLHQDFEQSAGHSNISYKVGAQYNLTQDVMAYLTYGTGYKSPAFATNQSFVGQNVYVKPETVRDFEAGIKTLLLDHRLRLNADGFVETFKDWQSQSFTPTGISYLGNAEGVRSSGVELNATYLPASRLTINYNGTVADAHFTKFTTDACYFGQSTASCPNGIFFNGTGIQLPTSARYRGTLQAMFSVLEEGDSKLTLEANWYHRSPLNYSSDGAPYTEAPSADIFGASLTYVIQGRLTAALFCKNCANRLVPTYFAADPDDAALGHLSVQQRWGYNSVRTIGASVNYNFK